MASEAKYLPCDGSTADLMRQTDSRLLWQGFAVTSVVQTAANLPVVNTRWICFRFTKDIERSNYFNGLSTGLIQIP